ncbi:DUF4191 domain-containing protein [Nocardioides jishulii]|uniref:DUF4191 domain-containing protein n=1 Tax=Nocardioides jishulii TaxID=2575440 RepID=A0A4U2YN34_9ACTN|nr:DUF4191 domain-containing protein [Nocardioides jishulii]QCX27791.1 DUF4191 family protein [Nocardioides jishulii]TKI62598.1 DUF4191 domain-containing protein [Nocardioides jishulii]
MSTPVTTDLSRRQQLVRSYRMAKQSDPRLGLWVLGAGLLGALVGFFGVAALPGDGPLTWVLAAVTGLLLGLLLAMVVFGRRAQKAAYAQMDGQVGAAAAALGMLRGKWKVDPAIGFTKQQDVVHRVVGPPGIVLVGEGSSPARLRVLMTNERRKHERVLADTPIHEVVCGKEEGQVPLDKLLRHVQKLGRQVKPAEMTDILNRLRALDANRSNIPMPKGPVPTSMKGMRGQMRGR